MPRTYPKPRDTVTPPMVTIRAFREHAGLTLDELAARIRAQGYPISKPGLGNIETGKRGPSQDFLVAWSAALGVNETPRTVDRDARASARCVA